MSARTRKRKVQRVVVVAHGHPSWSLGGAEVAAHSLFRGLDNVDGVEAHFVACASADLPQHSGSGRSSLRGGPREIALHVSGYDHVMLSNRDTQRLEDDFVGYLRDVAPDVVHFHHYLGLGLEALYAVRRALPDVAIVVTFHEYLAICHQHGQMVKRGSLALCERASPADCARCFPEVGVNTFYRREVFARTLLGLADRYVAPSRFLAQRYVDFGLPEERFEVIENGLTPTPTVAPRAAPPGAARHRFAFFGQVNPYKGVTVLLEAVAQASPEQWPDGAHLDIHGGGQERFSEDFRARFDALLARAGARASFHGPYSNESLATRIADVDWVVVPSLWWENSPVVIQEAFAHGRPVIASNLGGMAEKVQDGVDGLLFQAGSSASLAACLGRAATQADLWKTLRAGIRAPLDRDACARAHLALYRGVPRPTARSRRRATATA